MSAATELIRASRDADGGIVAYIIPPRKEPPARPRVVRTSRDKKKNLTAVIEDADPLPTTIQFRIVLSDELFIGDGGCKITAILGMAQAARRQRRRGQNNLTIHRPP